MPGYSQTETDSCLRCSEGHLLFLLGIQVSDQRVSLVDQYDQLIQQQLLSSLLGLRLLPICNDSRGTNSVRAGDTEDKLFWLLFWNLWDFYYLVLELVTSWDRWRFLQRLWSSWRRNFSNDTAYGVWFKDYRASTWQFGSSAANLLDCRDGHRTSCTYWVCRYDVYTYSGQVVCVCVCVFAQWNCVDLSKHTWQTVMLICSVMMHTEICEETHSHRDTLLVSRHQS